MIDFLAEKPVSINRLLTKCHNTECHYAECHYAECHYAECHYAKLRLRYVIVSLPSYIYKCRHYAECHYAKFV